MIMNEEKPKELATWFESLTDDQRIKVRNYLFEDFCDHCGRNDSNTIGGCQCSNDE